MISSMTGYGAASRQVPLTDAQGRQTEMSAAVTVELRSVNSRFLDLAFRMPDDCRSAETGLREMLTAALARGKLDCRINLQRPEGLPPTAAPDAGALAQLQRLQDLVKPHFPQAAPLSVAEILRWPGLLTEPALSQETLREAVLAAGAEALEQLKASRAREGEALAGILRARVEDMRGATAKLKPLLPQLLEQQQKKLEEKFTAALAPASEGAAAVISREEVAERIRQEVTAFGIRIDVAEELGRLDTHLTETLRILKAGGSVGKRLDFMMQELNREANTLGSKAAAIELTDSAMQLKLLIEQMREQVQNLE
ncbi:MAG: YicC family protein [Candidatus Protistobacter heckmanni]|nr:YicC family protein [Candidatus Protistobacter heckmanni]